MKNSSICHFLAIFMASGFISSTLNAEDSSKEKAAYKGISKSVVNLAQNSPEAAALQLGQTAIEYLLPSLGNDLPDWAKRIEFSGEVQSEGKPEWSVLTVQPLYQSDGNEKTVFTQLSQRRYHYLDTKRDVSNLGLGYRQLFNNSSILIGANSFFDFEWEREHKRVGLGAEAKWAGFDFAANGYWGLGSATSKGLSGDTREEVLDGFDFELGAQVPYMPWAKVYAKRFYWDTISNEDNIDGWRTTIDADIHQNLSLEAGWRDDNFSDSETFMMLTYKLGFHEKSQKAKPVALSSNFISSEAWNFRDMKEHTLDKVRRENRIIVERRSSGVVITRSN